MSVKYEENENGVFWVDGDQKGEPVKNLRAAMDDYELTVAGLKETDRNADPEQRIHTGDNRGGIATNDGSAGEEANRGASEEGAGGSEEGFGFADAPDSGSRGDGPEGP